MTHPPGLDLVIVEVALNGATLPTANPTVPRTPKAIAVQALECLAAGVAIVHSHPEAGTPAQQLAEYVAAWRPVVDVHPDALLYPTARMGAMGESFEDSWGHNLELGRLRLAAMSLVDPGSVNVGMRPDGSVAAGAVDTVYVNTHGETIARLDASAEAGLWPSISIFDPSFLRVVLALQRAGRVPSGSMVKLYFGQDEVFGLRPTVTALDAYLELLEGTGLPWSAAVLGGDVVAGGFAELVLDRGGHLRVGLEDLNGPGSRTNVDLVGEVVELITSTGRRVATPADARRILTPTS